jgi:hypothetical protein
MFKKTVFALLATTALSANAQNFGFETGDITGWNSSTLTATSTQTVQAGPNTWSINPYGSYMGTLQIQSGDFSSMTSALGLNSTSVTGITSLLQQQAQTGGGNPTPTTAGWVTRTVTLTAGSQFSLAWQYVSVDYTPYNDGSIATLTKAGSTNTTVVNNYNSQYALLGFTNPGTGDYSMLVVNPDAYTWYEGARQQLRTNINSDGTVDILLFGQGAVATKLGAGANWFNFT